MNKISGSRENPSIRQILIGLTELEISTLTLTLSLKVEGIWGTPS